MNVRALACACGLAAVAGGAAPPVLAGQVSVSALVYEPDVVLDQRQIALDDTGSLVYARSFRVRDYDRLSASRWLGRLLPLPGTALTRVTALVRFRLDEATGLTAARWSVARTGRQAIAGLAETRPPADIVSRHEGVSLVLPGDVFEISVPDSSARIRIDWQPR